MFNSHRPAGRVHGDGDVGGAGPRKNLSLCAINWNGNLQQRLLKLLNGRDQPSPVAPSSGKA